MAALCAALPEATDERYGRHATFRVRTRTFCYFLDDHHGDGIVAVAAKVPRGESALLIEDAPERFFSPAYVGPRGWVGLRLDRGEVDWDEVAELFEGSYRLSAPKRLVALLDQRAVGRQGDGADGRRALTGERRARATAARHADRRHHDPPTCTEHSRQRTNPLPS